VEQETIAATVFERQGDRWTAFAATEDDSLYMPEIKVKIPLAELYEQLDLSADRAD
jgi:hypothetical protein